MADDATILRLRKQWDASGWNATWKVAPGALNPDWNIEIPLEDFKKAFRAEFEARFNEAIGSVTWTVTNAQKEAKVASALDIIFSATIDDILAAAKREAKPA